MLTFTLRRWQSTPAILPRGLPTKKPPLPYARRSFCHLKRAGGHSCPLLGLLRLAPPMALGEIGASRPLLAAPIHGFARGVPPLTLLPRNRGPPALVRGPRGRGPARFFWRGSPDRLRRTWSLPGFSLDSPFVLPASGSWRRRDSGGVPFCRHLERLGVALGRAGPPAPGRPALRSRPSPCRSSD